MEDSGEIRSLFLCTAVKYNSAWSSLRGILSAIYDSGQPATLFEWISYLWKLLRKSMEVWRKILSYITFKKQSAPANGSDGFNLRAMHTINKISILMFLVGLIVLIVKMFTWTWAYVSRPISINFVLGSFWSVKQSFWWIAEFFIKRKKPFWGLHS